MEAGAPNSELRTAFLLSLNSFSKSIGWKNMKPILLEVISLIPSLFDT